MQEILKELRDQILVKNYSKRTADAYSDAVRSYINFRKGDISYYESKLKEYVLSLKSRNYAPKTIALHLNAIKFFYKYVVGEEIKLSFRIKATPRKLPVILTKNEIQKIVDSIINTKHKLIVKIAYGAGLRVGEVVKLRVCDINFDSMLICIRQSKGAKDRLTILPEKLATDLRKHTFAKNSSDYVFESERGGKLHPRTLQKILINAVSKAGIKSNPSFHSLRHSFATHLLESGISINIIQQLLGHKDIKTTMIYSKVSNTLIRNISSPL